MNRNHTLITISLGVWGIGEGFFIFFQPLYLQKWGADPLLIGGIYGMMGIAMACSQIPAGVLSDRFGSRSIMWASWLLGTLAAWVMALANSLPVFITGMILYGLTGFVLAPMNSYITQVRGDLSVSRALTIPSALYSLGSVAGPILGGLVADRLGYQTVYLIGACLFILSTGIVMFVGKETGLHREDANSERPKGVFTNQRFIAYLVIVFVTIIAMYMPIPLTPNFLQNQQHFSGTQIGILGAFGSLGSAVSMLAISRVAPLAGLLISQVMLGLFALIFMTAGSFPLFAVGYFFTGGYRLCRAMVLTMGRELIHPSQTGLAYGMIETMNALAVIIAPVLAGVLYQHEPLSMYRIGAILLLFVFVLNYFIFALPKRKRINLHDT